MKSLKQLRIILWFNELSIKSTFTISTFYRFDQKEILRKEQYRAHIKTDLIYGKTFEFPSNI